MAAAELKRVRRNFVQKMTKEIIRQLIDDLYEAEVLNEGEKDSILEENPATAEKARVLIDTVVKKGDEASRKMIASLQRIDAEIFSSLGLQASVPQEEQNPSPVLQMNYHGQTQ